MFNKTLINPPERSALPPYVQWSAAQGNALLSPMECEWVIACASKMPLSFASVGTPQVQRTELDTRCVESTALDVPEMAPIYDRIAERVKWANDQHYQFDLTGMIEPIQFLKYTPAGDAKPDGHYVWHVDFGEGAMATRKLSMIIQLSPPQSYDGCKLTLHGDSMPFEMPIVGQGDAFMFPSWAPHMVSPITRGVRYALVVWVHGPRFR